MELEKTTLYEELALPDKAYYPTVNRLQDTSQRLEELRQELISLSPTSEKTET